jgi:hypothetical protein
MERSYGRATAFTLLSTNAVALEQLLVVWDAEVNAKYDVSYTFGTTGAEEEKGLVYTYYVPESEDEPNVMGAGYELGSVRLPLVGGTTAVTVTPYFIGDRDFYKSEAITEKIDRTLSILAAPTIPANTDDDSTLAPTRDGPNVLVKWNEVKGADGYEVYKAEFDLGDSGGWTTGAKKPTGNIALVGDWAEVGITGAVLKYGEDGTGTYTAVDPNVPLDKDYVYLVIAKKGEIKSLPANFYIGKQEPLADEPEWSLTSDAAKSKVTVEFKVETGKTYTLAKALVTFTDAAITGDDGITEDTTPAKVETWTPISDTSTDPLYKVFIDDNPVKRSYYQYRLNVTETTSVSGTVTRSYYKNLYNQPFAETVKVKPVATGSTETYKAVTLTFEGFKESEDTDLSINIYIYRATAEVTGTSPSEKVNVTSTYEKITAESVPVTKAVIAGWEDKDTKLVVGQYYSYRVEVFAEKKKLHNLETTLEAHVQPSNAAKDWPSTATAVLAGTTLRIKLAGASDDKPLLANAQVYRATKTALKKDIDSADWSSAEAFATITRATADGTGDWVNKISKGDYYFEMTFPGNDPTNDRKYAFTVESGSKVDELNEKALTVDIAASVTAWPTTVSVSEDANAELTKK